MSGDARGLSNRACLQSVSCSVIEDVRMGKAYGKHSAVWFASVLSVSKSEKACTAQMCIGAMEISAHEVFALWQTVGGSD